MSNPQPYRPHKNNQSAFTLIELLITLSLALILSGLALPSFKDILEDTKLTTQIDDLAKTLRYSRATAINENNKVTICPTDDTHTCISDWSLGYMSFVDINGNRRLDANETILTIYQNKKDKADLSWRAFGFRKSIQWLETGITNHQNGTFYFCHEDASKSRALIITKAGRIRYSKDTNGDDLHENASGKPLSC
jgi:type IV fimbrial biogenesis protein FimT